MNSEVLLARLAEEERDRAALLRLEADRLERRASELDLYAQADVPAGRAGTQGAKLLSSGFGWWQRIVADDRLT